MTPYFYNGPRYTLQTLERIVALIPADRWDQHRYADRFTPREVLAHLADWEPILQERIRGGVEEEGFVITPYDEGERAIAQNYQAQDPQESLQRFRASREQTIELIKGLSEEQLRRALWHPEIGGMQVADIIAMITGHDAYHLDQLSEYLTEKVVGFW
jgi:uncharacterized damage-inducible protein DinB